MKQKYQTSRQGATRAPFHTQPVALACAVLMLGSGLAEAQQTSDQTVVVTGIRRAIESSIAVKRNSDSITEAVSSEDIGKLPESSVADALARLPGVTGQRGASGRTDLISIRGLGPKYGGAVMNGREMVSSNDGRAVEFDQFPSELVSGLVVYKTPDAALIGQGLSGTVDVRTLKPLDMRGRQVVINGNMQSNSNNQSVAGGGSTTGKRLSMSYVDQYADNTLGLSLGYAHLDTPAQTVSNRINEYVNPYNNSTCIASDAPSWCPVPAKGLPKQANLGGAFDYAAFPQRFEVFAETKSNVRDGLMATLEYKPNKDLHSQLDLFYSKFKSRTVSSGFQAELYNGIWSGDPAEQPVFSNVTTQQAGGNTIVTAGTMDHIANGAINNTSNRTDQTTAFGWNTAYKLGNAWTAVADLSMSQNKRDESFYEAYASNYSAGKFLRGAFNFVTPGTDPNLLMKITPAGATSLVDPTSMRVGDPFGYASSIAGWAGPVRKPHTDDEIKSLRLSAKRDLTGMFSSLDLGVNYSQRDKVITKNQFDLVMKKDAAGNYINTVPSAYLRTPADLSAYGVPPVISIDAEGLANSGFYNTVQALWLTTTSDTSVHEKVTTGYVKADIDTDVGGFAVRGNVGAQLVRTNQSSTGWSWLGGADQTQVQNLRQITGGKSYTDFLPSLNLVVDLKSDVIARFGLAKTMVRPEMNDLRAGTSATLKPLVKDAKSGAAEWTTDVAGNPELEPWRATSIDLSLEKYLGKQSYVAVALYRKNVLNSIYTQDVLRDFSNVPYDPVWIPKAGLVKTSAPANGKGGYIEGLELSGALEGRLINPMLDGFGVIASGTRVNSSLHAGNDQSLPLDGLSGNTTSVTLFYEKYGFSARVNETHRSPFLAQTRNWDYTTNYTKTSAENIVNLQFGYSFDSGLYKGVSLALQVNNVTDARLVTEKSVGAQGANPDPTALVPYEVRKFGRQLGFGVGYKF